MTSTTATGGYGLRVVVVDPFDRGGSLEAS